jgi:site-specific DNA recombinase
MGGCTRYYVSTDVLKRDGASCLIGRLPAGEIETAVIGQLRVLLSTPEIIVQTWRAARKLDSTIAEADVRTAIEQLEPIWDELFPTEQARIVQLLVERVDVGPTGVDIHLRTEGLTSLIGELRAVAGHAESAAV